MRSALLILVIFITQYTWAQDLTGIWRGSFVSSDRITGFSTPSERYKLEVQIAQDDKTFNSVTYSYRTTLFYGKAAANGTVNPKTGMVWLEETKIVEVKMLSGSSACIMTYRLKYSKNDGEEFLEGTWNGYQETDSSFCGKGTVILHKVPTSDFYKEPFVSKSEAEKKKKPVMPPTAKKSAVPDTKAPVTKPATKPPAVKKPAAPITKATPPATKPANPPLAKTTPPKAPTGSVPGKSSTVQKPKTTVGSPAPVVKPLVPKPLQTNPEITQSDTLHRTQPQMKKSVTPIIIPRVLATRENEVLKTITINTNDVFINIYDNGTIDHDTVSVYLDKKLVISKQMLTTSPINLTFRMDDINDTHELVMVAENQGDIPPNTSLMVVKAGDKEYEVRITSTEQKNAVIIFKYERPK